MPIGIMGAMPEEVTGLLEDMDVQSTDHVGMRDYHCGEIYGRDAVIVFSRWGKVAAASTATSLIERYGVEQIIFTGMAGAADPDLNIGDVVIGNMLVMHDMDVSPLPGFERYDIPLLGLNGFKVSDKMVNAALEHAQEFLSEHLLREADSELLKEMGIREPKAIKGTIASGDRFVADSTYLGDLRLDFGDELACVEMEGAAVAQVCHEYNIPMIVSRCISDKADHSATIDFGRFCKRIAPLYARGIVRGLIPEL